VNPKILEFNEEFDSKKSLSLFIYLFVFCPFRAVPAAYGGSQARGWIRATAAALRQSHSNARSEPHLWPTPQLMAHWILNPLSKARDRNFNLMVPSQIRLCSATGTPSSWLSVPESCYKTSLFRCKLLYVNWINKILLYSRENYSRYPVIKPQWKRIFKVIHTYIW